MVSKIHKAAYALGKAVYAVGKVIVAIETIRRNISISVLEKVFKKKEQ